MTISRFGSHLFRAATRVAAQCAGKPIWKFRAVVFRRADAATTPADRAHGLRFEAYTDRYHASPCQAGTAVWAGGLFAGFGTEAECRCAAAAFCAAVAAAHPDAAMEG